jgi:DNA-binding PadR family transcriptional regulator
MPIDTRGSALGLIVLALLIEEPMHAYRMQKLIRERGKDQVVNVRRGASIYQTLDRLQRLELIDVKETVRTASHPDRTVYAITHLGRDTARTWLRDALTAVGGDFPEFPAAVSVLTMLTPADARKQFETRAEAVRTLLSTLEAESNQAKDLPRLFLLEDAYRVAVLEAELTWLDAVITDLVSGSLGWDKRWLRQIAATFRHTETE